MRYIALASDYDGTLAHDGRVSEQTIRAIQRFRQSGRKLILVTGRVLEDLERVFRRFDLLDCVVAENGAVLFTPATLEKVVLAPAPKPEFVDELWRRGVRPIEVGEAIVATWQPNEAAVLEVIRDLGLELQVIFNKGAVMVLPSGVNKSSGLSAALAAMKISEHNVAGVGDAENDHAFLECCEFSVAVANAHPSVKSHVDLVTKGDHGAGVVELMEMILKDDLAAAASRARMIPVGREGEREFSVPACDDGVLVAGASGSGKSTFVAGLLEVLIQKRYQVCLIDPEGDYQNFPETIPAGDEKHPPSIDEILQILKKPNEQLVVNLLGIGVPERPAFLGELLPRLDEMRLRTGRPHWIVVDEAHHMLAPEFAPAAPPADWSNMILITVHPERVAPAFLQSVESVFVVGPDPGKVLEAFAKAVGAPDAPVPPGNPEAGQVLAWFRSSGEIHWLTVRPPRAERKRHMRNYAQGELGEDRSFYFRGARGKLNLRAQNLNLFLQMANGVDDETWLHHLRQGDYSKWFGEAIKDQDLAEEAAQVERDASLGARESRERIKAAIEKRYTAAV
jgi:HAD superfamily hydrolase (TIGR01484 family)